jgi:hypothetical protein
MERRSFLQWLLGFFLGSPVLLNCGQVSQKVAPGKKVQTPVQKALMYLSQHKAEVPKYLLSWYALLARSGGDLEIAFKDAKNAPGPVAQKLFCELVDMRLKLNVVDGKAAREEVETANELAFWMGFYGLMDWKVVEAQNLQEVALMAAAFFATGTNVSVQVAYNVVDQALYEKEDPSRLAWAIMAGQRIERDVKEQKALLEKWQREDGSWVPKSGGNAWLATAHAVAALKGSLL